MRFDGNGEETFFAVAGDICPLIAQRVEQAFHWAFAHLGYTVDFEDTTRSSGTEGGKKARGGAGVADEKFGAFSGNFAGLSFDVDGFFGLGFGYPDAEATQTRRPHARIIP